MSLRLRLALWYGVLTGLVVLLVSLVTYAVHSRAHYDDLDHMMASAVQHLSEEHAGARTADEFAAIVAVPIAPDLAMRVYSETGKVVAASPNAAPAPMVDPVSVVAQPSIPPFDPIVGLAPPFVAVDPGRGAFGVVDGTDGERWRLYVLPVDASASYLVAAAPLGRIDASVGRLRQLGLLLALTGAAVTFIGGRLLAGRALRPVASLTETASAIARSSDFKRRVRVGPRLDELGRLATTFNAMLASLEGAYKSQQRFVSDASHELRAPLTAIQANLELLERRTGMSGVEQKEAIGEASRETRRLARLVADLLALARADAGIPVRHQRVELDRVLVDALGEARHLAGGQRIDVDKLEPALVQGDPDRLKQLLLVLLDNAVKYTPTGGKITLGLRRTGLTAEVVVRDTGVGIPTEDLPRVFERFYRADPARTRDPGGTGLGLPIARWIAQQHGGDVTLSSELGRGTTATVRLPIIG